MKKIFLILNVLFINQCFADNIIYKCTNSFGEVTYENTSVDKSSCVKTELGNFVSKPTISFDKTKVKNYTNDLENNSNIDTSIIKEEQKERDLKRILILEQELSTEKEQLKSLNDVLLNLNNSNDKEQINKLNELKNNHINNIDNIQKEIDLTKKKNNISDNENKTNIKKRVINDNELVNKNINKISFTKNNDLSNERIDKNMYIKSSQNEKNKPFVLNQNYEFRNDTEFKMSSLSYTNNETTHSLENFVDSNKMNNDLFGSLNLKFNLELSNFETVIKHKYLIKKINELN